MLQKFVTNRGKKTDILMLKQGCVVVFFLSFLKFKTSKASVSLQKIQSDRRILIRSHLLKPKMGTKFKHGRDLHRPSAKLTMQRNL